MYIDHYASFALPINIQNQYPWRRQLHSFVVHSFRDEIVALPLQEIHTVNATTDEIVKLTKNFTFPLAIRGLLKNSSAVKLWHSSDWWLEHYADEGM